jgi:DnaJ-class molecular chaperone
MQGLVEQYEIACPECEGVGVVDSGDPHWIEEVPCGECSGTGVQLTEEGHALLSFLSKHFQRAHQRERSE